MKWLTNLITKINAVSDEEITLHQPKEKVAEGEKVIGSVSKNLQKAYACFKILITKLEVLKKEHSKEHKRKLADGEDHMEESCHQFWISVSELEEEIEVTKTAFWAEIRQEMKIKAEDIGIRENWQIVEITKEKSDDMFGDSLISMILGSDIMLR